MTSTIRVAIALILLLSPPCALWAASINIIFYSHATHTESVVSESAEPVQNFRPRLNDLGEVVWAQHIAPTMPMFGIYSNQRGLIKSGLSIRDPDINNSGEVIWRFGDGGQDANGVESNVRGILFSGIRFDPYYDTQRINDTGEIIASREDANPRQLWSSVRGDLPFSGSYARATEINDLGEIVYKGSYPGLPTIFSTTRGRISDAGVFADNPEINNLGEIVWQQSGCLCGDGTWEIWSNIRGKIGRGIEPSINDSGEIVWQGVDWEIYSSVQGRLTFSPPPVNKWVVNQVPRINNLGDITWLRREGSVPEPAAVWMVLTVAFLLGLRRQVVRSGVTL